MKTNELTGASLDFWVARAEGAMIDSQGRAVLRQAIGKERALYVCPVRTQRTFAPSMYWAQGGPIIAQRAIAFAGEPGGTEGNGQWLAYFSDGPDAWEGRGDTHLVAAMRAVVCRVYGDEVPDL